MLEINLLGDISVTYARERITDFATRKEIALLAYLACTGREHAREALAELLWEGRAPQQSRSNLRTLLSYLRKHIGDHLKTTRTTAMFATGLPYSLDVAAFDAEIAFFRFHAAQQRPLTDAEAQRLTHALHLYRGDFLAGFHVRGAQQFEEWALMQAESLRRSAIEGLHLLIDHEQGKGDYAAGLAHGTRLLTLAPLNEAAHRKQMLLLARSGQRNAALAQYHTCHTRLQQELHITPEAQTTALYERIFNGEFDAPQADDRPAHNPYKGLRAFQEDDAHEFFGRERTIQEMLVRLGIEPPASTDDWQIRFLAIVGPSGSGKSSVVRAGLIPLLRQLSRWGGNRWHIVTLTPGDRPLDALHAALRATFPHLPRSPLHAVLEHHLPPNDRCLLVIDQCEELFTRDPAPAQRDTFMDSIWDALHHPDSRLWVLITLRADYYDQPLRHLTWGRLVGAHTFAITPLALDELRRTIVGPAQAVNVAIDPALVATLVADAGQTLGALPLLQYTLTELFDRRTTRVLTLDDYRAIGGLTGAMVRRTDALYLSLTPEEQTLTRRIFLHLVEVGHITTDGRALSDTRRRVPRAELAARAAATPAALEKILTLFSRYRLLTHDHDPATHAPTVEIAHESLIEHWGRLQTWLEASRDDLHQQRSLAHLATAWEAAGRDPGYLAHGTQLRHFEQWRATTDTQLASETAAFLQTSLDQRAEHQTAESARLARETTLRRRAESLYLATQAQLALARSDTGAALALATQASHLDATIPQVQLILSEAAYAPGTRRLYAGHTGPITGLAVKADGNHALSASADGTLILWDLHTGEIAQHFTAVTEGSSGSDAGAVTGVCLLPGDRQALSSAADGSLTLWDVVRGRAVRRYQGHRAATCVAVSPCGHVALSGESGGDLTLWHIDTGARLDTLHGHTGTVHGVAFSPDGRHALSGSADRSVIYWALTSSQGTPTRIVHRLTGHQNTLDALTETRQGHNGPVWGVAFCADPARALSVSQDQQTITWDLTTGTLCARQHSGAGLYSLAAHPTASRVLVGLLDGRIAHCDVQKGTCDLELVGHKGRVQALAFVPGGQHVLSGAADGAVRLWDLHNGAEVRRMQRKWVGCDVDVSRDGRLGVVALWDGTIALWDVQTGAWLRELRGHTEMVFAGARFTPNGDRIVSGAGEIHGAARDNTIRVWDVATGAEVLRCTGHTGNPWSVAVGPRGEYAVSGAHDGTLRRWDLTTGAGRVLLDVAPQAVRSVAFHPDGRTVLCGLARGSSVAPNYDLRLVDIATGAVVRRYPGHAEVVPGVAFGPAGRLVLSGGNDQRAILWDVTTGRVVHHLRGHTSSVTAVAFGTRGALAATGDLNGNILLWDVESGALLRRYMHETHYVLGLVFIPGDRALVSTTVNNTVRQWRLDVVPDALREWIAENRYVPESVAGEAQGMGNRGLPA